MPEEAKTASPLYPDIAVELTGHDGNAFVIIGTVRKALRRGLLDAGDMDAGEITREVQRFSDEATSGDYDHLLQTCMRWVDVS